MNSIPEMLHLPQVHQQKRDLPWQVQQADQHDDDGRHRGGNLPARALQTIVP